MKRNRGEMISRWNLFQFFALAGVLAACPLVAGSGPPAGPEKSDAARQREIRKWIESIRKSKTWRGYRIGGRVVDQYGKPVEGAKIEIQVTSGSTVRQLLDFAPVKTYHVKTDGDGRFRLTVRGIEPGVTEIQKFGYVWMREQDDYPPTVVLPEHHTTLWVNPHLAAGDAVFHMWKKGPRSILLKRSCVIYLVAEDRTRDTIDFFRLLPFFDWRNKRGKDFDDFRPKERKRLEAADPFASAEDRDLLMSLGFDMAVRVHPDPKAEKWRVTLWMFRPDDGIFFTTNRRLAVAPESGYKRQLDFTVPFKYQDEKGNLLPERRIEGRLFFRFFKPVLYSTSPLFTVETRPSAVRVNTDGYLVNPYGGRNLEPDWGIPNKITFALEDELKAAILAADAGKPVTLPDEAKYKKMLEDLLAKDPELRKKYEYYNTETRYQRWP